MEGETFLWLIRHAPVDGVAGTKVKLVVVRDGKQKTLNATLKEIL